MKTKYSFANSTPGILSGQGLHHRTKIVEISGHGMHHHVIHRSGEPDCWAQRAVVFNVKWFWHKFRESRLDRGRSHDGSVLSSRIWKPALSRQISIRENDTNPSLKFFANNCYRTCRRLAFDIWRIHIRAAKLPRARLNRIP